MREIILCHLDEGDSPGQVDRSHALKRVKLHGRENLIAPAIFSKRKSSFILKRKPNRTEADFGRSFTLFGKNTE